MSEAEDFLSAEEEQRIVDAIVEAENRTSGEIRVHIEQAHSGEVMQRATEIFYLLEMHKTAAQNGVLFYVNVTQKQFAIIGDEGIDKKVPDDFWNSTKDVIIQHFKQKDFAKGLLLGIKEAGKQLKTYFPILENDINELPNEISKS